MKFGKFSEMPKNVCTSKCENYNYKSLNHRQLIKHIIELFPNGLDHIMMYWDKHVPHIIVNTLQVPKVSLMGSHYIYYCSKPIKP